MLCFEDSAISCGAALTYGLDRSTPAKQVMEIANAYFEECGDWVCPEYGNDSHVCAHRSHATNYAHFLFSDVVKIALVTDQS